MLGAPMYGSKDFHNRATRYSVFFLDTTRVWRQNSQRVAADRLLFWQAVKGPVMLRALAPIHAIGAATRGAMQYLPGWTVQCINPGCEARGCWLRADTTRNDQCSNCGAPLHNVPPPLGPRMRMRPRSLGGPRMPPRLR